MTILVGIVLGGSSHAIETGQATRARADLARISQALDEYQHRYGDFPRTDQPADLLQSLLGRRGPDGEPCDDAPLLDLSQLDISNDNGSAAVAGGAILDPWRRPYVYIYKVPLAGWTNPEFVLCSLGAPGTPLGPLAAGGYWDSAVRANSSVLIAGGN